MDTKAPPNPDSDATLAELASLGMRAARAVAQMMEIEQEAADVVASWLPEKGREPASLTEAHTAGHGVDMVTEAMQHAVPRIEALTRAFERVSRSVRYTVALTRRIEAGWPRAASDNRQAMVRRQIARGVTEAIRREAVGEAAERLFDSLAERMEDPGLEHDIAVLPVDQIIRRICRDLGLAAATLRSLGDGQPPTPDTGWAVDTS